MSYHVPNLIDTNPRNMRHGLYLLRQIWFKRAEFEQTIQPYLHKPAILRRIALQMFLPTFCITSLVFGVPLLALLIFRQTLVKKTIILDLGMQRWLGATVLILAIGILLMIRINPQQSLALIAGLPIMPLSWWICSIVLIIELWFVNVPRNGIFIPVFTIPPTMLIPSIAAGIYMFQQSIRRSEQFDQVAKPVMLWISGLAWFGLEIASSLAIMYGNLSFDRDQSTFWSADLMNWRFSLISAFACWFGIEITNRDHY